MSVCVDVCVFAFKEQDFSHRKLFEKFFGRPMQQNTQIKFYDRLTL